MKNLLDSVQDLMTDAIMDKTSSALGLGGSELSSSLSKFLPAIIGGVINKGSDTGGATKLLDLFNSGNFGAEKLENLGGVLDDSDATSSFLETGSNLLSMLFGNRTSGLTDLLINMTGLNKMKGNTILKFLAPIVINKLAGMVAGNNMGASGLSSYLNDQKSDIMGRIPGLAGFFAESESKERVGTAAAAASSAATAAKANITHETHDKSDGGLGWLKWLLPLLIGAGLIYFLTKDGCNSKPAEKEMEKTEVNGNIDDNDKSTKANMTENSENAAADPVSISYNINDNGDIVNTSGDVIYASGTYAFDSTGNLVGEDGKVLIEAANISSDFLEKLKQRMRGVLSNASDKTLESMRALFGDMLAKKSGVMTSYSLSDIEFNIENHRISNFSKAEVEGLAQALKANEKGSIEVQVFTNDGKNDKENKMLSEKRATVVKDMLVTLGVNKGQISATGKGSTNEAKSQINKVDIVVK